MRSFTGGPRGGCIAARRPRNVAASLRDAGCGAPASQSRSRRDRPTLPPIRPSSRESDMELPDEAITYNYQGLLAPCNEEWTAAAELRAGNFVSPARLKELHPRLLQCRSQVA